MAKRTSAPAPREGITDDRIQELEERMQRLQETMDVLIGSIDEFREAQEVMARLREEAARGGGEPAVATAAEGDPSPAPTVDGAAGNGHTQR
jgi:hypothetical protein